MDAVGNEFHRPSVLNESPAIPTEVTWKITEKKKLV